MPFGWGMSTTPKIKQKQVSKEKLQARIAKIREQTSSFCKKKLDDDYQRLITKLIEKLEKESPSPLLKGKEEIWSAAIVHSLGQVNFLYDKSSEPYVRFDLLNAYFRTKKSTVGNRAKEIRTMFGMDSMTNTEFMTERYKESNQLLNMVMVDGFIVHISSLPAKYQEIAKQARDRGEQIKFKTKK